MSRFLRYAERMYNCPLLITAEKARILEQVIRAHEENRAALLSPPIEPPRRRELAVPGMVRTDGGYLRTSDGVAIIPMLGTFVQRSGDEDLDAMSGLVSYSTMTRQMQAAGMDARVEAILMEIDSLGGEVPGIVDFVEAIRAVGQTKPVWAHANEQAFSAGMWVAAAAARLYAPKTGNVGSIGVRMLHVDQSIRDARQGLVYTEIIAGARKNDFTPHAPLSEPARETAQAECDRIYALFAADVARFRGIDEREVRATEAQIYSAQAALEMGLIDGVQSFDETLAALSAETSRVRIYGMRVSAKAPTTTPAMAATEGAIIMATPDNTAATAAQLAEAEARGRAAAEAESAKLIADAQAKAAKEAAEAAQARISGILSHAEAVGRRAQAEHLAFKTATTVEDAVAILATAQKETAAPENLLAKAMAKIDNPTVGADGGGDGEDAETAATVARIAGYANSAKKLKAVK